MTLPKDYRPPDPPSLFSRYKWWLIFFIIVGSIYAISLYYGIKSFLGDSIPDWISFKFGISFAVGMTVAAVGSFIFDFRPDEYASETKQWMFYLVRHFVLPFICACIIIAVFILIL